MSSARAFHSLRSCITALSSRTFNCPRTRLQSRLLASGTRYYSETPPTTEAPEAPVNDVAGGENQKTDQAKDARNDPPKDAELDLAAKLKAKGTEVQELTGRLRYLQADFLNLQRNAAREKEQTRDFAITRFASDLLETADVLSMALKSVPPSVLAQCQSSPESPPLPPASSDSPAPPTEPAPKSPSAYLAELYTGVEMTHRLLLQTLFKYHVKPFDPTGDKFDPNLHEALYQVPIPGKEPGTIVDCRKVGYMIKDRVLRAPQVGVAQDPAA